MVLRLPLERDAWRKGVHRLYKTGSGKQSQALSHFAMPLCNIICISPDFSVQTIRRRLCNGCFQTCRSFPAQHPSHRAP